MKHDQLFWKNFFKQQQAEHDPVSRLMEILFGLIMVLTFTLTISISHDGKPEIRHLLTGALGCNIAWGFIDAVMFVIAAVLLRGRGITLLNALRNTRKQEEANAIISNSLQPLVAELVLPEQVEALYSEFMKLPAPPKSAPIVWSDIKGGLSVFLLVFLSTFPVTLPFLIIEDPILAKHVSNAIVLVLLFAGGYSLGKYSGFRPWGTGFVMIFIGAGLSLIAMALGG